ncbi:hypothetical protein OPQ81_011103 [Rhizoctonia solani]|nr:hypothetical protein OPQ81_011103 [Rhizoctonia solani]
MSDDLIHDFGARELCKGLETVLFGPGGYDKFVAENARDFNKGLEMLRPPSRQSEGVVEDMIRPVSRQSDNTVESDPENAGNHHPQCSAEAPPRETDQSRAVLKSNGQTVTKYHVKRKLKTRPKARTQASLSKEKTNKHAVGGSSNRIDVSIAATDPPAVPSADQVVVGAAQCK